MSEKHIHKHGLNALLSKGQISKCSLKIVYCLSTNKHARSVHCQSLLALAFLSLTVLLRVK